jgi:hypothetical protein
MVFATHQADMLLPASQNAERDPKAQFVHLVNLTPALITLQKRSQCADRSTPSSVRLKSEQIQLVSVVRCFWDNHIGLQGA